MLKFIMLLCGVVVLAVTAAAQDDGLDTAYTYQQASGNRVVAGTGTFPAVQTVDIATSGAPQWVYGDINRETGQPRWRFLLPDGTFHLTTGTGELPLSIRFVPGQPIMYALDSFETYYPSAGADASPLTHAIPLGRPGARESASLYIAVNGDVVTLEDDLEVSRLALNALPDARPVVSASGQVALYTGATTDRYVHAVLGDAAEAASLTILDIDGATATVATQIMLPGDDVFEGIAPLWADVDGDGADDLVTTVSNGVMGAQLRVYRADGSVLANGPPIGQGNRWRHQLAVGAFGPGGETEIVAVRTPHIGGIVEFYRLNGASLEIVATLTRYSSHPLGSRNLDMAVAGDFNGDDQPEIVVPDQARGRIAGVQNTAGGAVEVWSLPLDGALTSNLFGLMLPDGRLALAAGTDANKLRAWLPE